MQSSPILTRSSWFGRFLHLALFFIILFVLYQKISVFTHNLTVPSHFSTIDWPSSQVNACSETSCFLRPPFSPPIPKSEALEADILMKKYLKKYNVPTIREISGQSPPFRECSVIGGSPKSPNKKHAVIVDSSIVFRMNKRVPEFLEAESIQTALGTRTDVLVLQYYSTKHIQAYTKGWGHGNNKTRLQARLRAGARVRAQHPVILYKTECTRPKSCPKAWSGLIDSGVSSWLPVSFINPHHEMEARRLLNRERKGVYELPSKGVIPTTGLITIITALSNCRQVNLFGFNGSPTADGHFGNKTVSAAHAMTSERNLVQWLSKCPRKESWMCGRLRMYS